MLFYRNTVFNQFTVNVFIFGIIAVYTNFNSYIRMRTFFIKTSSTYFNKINFILDNFDVIEKVNEFTDMMGSGLSKGIKFAIATRSLDDLINKYDVFFEDGLKDYDEVITWETSTKYGTGEITDAMIKYISIFTPKSRFKLTKILIALSKCSGIIFSESMYLISLFE